MLMPVKPNWAFGMARSVSAFQSWPVTGILRAP
jgi:hypothetical protein